MKKFKKFLKDNKVILITLFIFSLLVYGYAGLNTIINLDGIDDFMIKNKISGYRLYLSVGRWGWSLIGLFFNYYPSPFICLILNSCLFSIMGVYIGRIFNIQNKLYTILLSMIIIAFPANILAYTYLPWQYSIGIGYLASIYSVYLMKNSTKKIHILYSALCIAFSTSIYQSFLPLIITLSILVFIINLGKASKLKELFKKMLTFLYSGVLGGVIYYLIVKLSTFIFNVQMNSYQGANQMFNMNFKEIFDNIGINVIQCLYNDYGPFFSSFIKYSLIIMMMISFIYYLIKMYNKKISYGLTLTGLLLLLLISPKILSFIKPNVWTHIITYIPYAIVYSCSLCILIETISIIKKEKNRIILDSALKYILIITCFSFLINANKAFVMSRQATEASFHYLNRIQMRIEEVEGYDELPNPKKYYLYRPKDFEDMNSFPLSEYAYSYVQGVTWTFIAIPKDTIAAFNLMGENVVEGKLTKEERDEVKSLIEKVPEYPEEGSIFIYKDIVIIRMANKE